MESSKPHTSSDEKVYQDNKQDINVTKVYSNEPDDDKSEQREKHPTEPAVKQEKAVIDTFPASDPPATSAPTTSTPPKKKE